MSSWDIEKDEDTNSQDATSQALGANGPTPQCLQGHQPLLLSAGLEFTPTRLPLTSLVWDSFLY